MNNKIKKLMVTLLLGITLCGSVLTVQAVTPRTCGHPETAKKTTTTTYNEVYTHVIKPNNVEQVCTITVPHTKIVVTCGDCGAVLHTEDHVGTATHSLKH